MVGAQPEVASRVASGERPRRDAAHAGVDPVAYLDAVTATEFARHYKQLTYSLLRAGRGSHVLDVGCGTGEDVDHMHTEWLVELNPGSAEKLLSLICVPYAGGGTTVFRSWARAVPAAVRLLAMQLPGRERRCAEPALSTIPEIVAAAGPAIAAAVRRPFVIFGHSGGALVAFALARWLEERHGRSPVSLVVSGSRAPSSPAPRAPLHGLADADLRRRLGEMGGMPKELLAQTNSN